MSKSTIKKYTLEFKQSSARLAAGSEHSILKTAKELGPFIPGLSCITRVNLKLSIRRQKALLSLK